MDPIPSSVVALIWYSNWVFIRDIPYEIDVSR